MQFLAIILLSILSAVIYGIIHDQITARICIEYFTIGHFRIIDSDDPTVVGLVWGVIATWWAGLILGVPLALASRVGRWQRVSVRELIRPIVIMLSIVALLAGCAGIIGNIAARKGWVILIGDIAQRVPENRHIPFLTDLWIHSASYLFGFVGGVVLIVYVMIRRGRRSNMQPML